MAWGGIVSVLQRLWGVSCHTVALLRRCNMPRLWTVAVSARVPWFPVNRTAQDITYLIVEMSNFRCHTPHHHGNNPNSTAVLLEFTVSLSESAQLGGSTAGVGWLRSVGAQSLSIYDC